MHEEHVFPGTLTTLGYEVPGTLYTLGYATPGSADALEELMTASEVLIIDIRERAQSRWWPVWNKKQLRARWGSRYTHEKQLGNINRRDRSLPVVLHGPHPEQAIGGIAALLVQGYSVVLLCACREYETCHRKVVAEMIQQAMKGEQDAATNA